MPEKIILPNIDGITIPQEILIFDIYTAFPWIINGTREQFLKLKSTFEI